jgi:hypothetical protein
MVLLKWFANIIVLALILATMLVGYVKLFESNKKKIIILEGFREGVIICGEDMFINEGYELDPRVEQLIKLAENNC